MAAKYSGKVIVDIVDGELPGDVQQVLNLRRGTEKPDEIAFGFVTVCGRTLALLVGL